MKGLTSGFEGLFKKNKVDYIQGWGKLQDRNTISVDLNKGGKEVFNTKNVIIATGSEPTPFPGLPFDEKIIVSSTGKNMTNLGSWGFSCFIFLQSILGKLNFYYILNDFQ